MTSMTMIETHDEAQAVIAALELYRDALEKHRGEIGKLLLYKGLNNFSDRYELVQKMLEDARLREFVLKPAPRGNM